MLDRVGIFPLAVVVAMAIFFAREVLDAIRRFNSNRRKIRAVKEFVAAECERNHYTVRWLRGRLPTIREAISKERPIELRKDAVGKYRLRLGSSESQMPRSHSAVLDKYLFEVASLDGKLFELMQEVSVDVLELQHLCDGLVQHTTDEKFWLQGWTDYAEGELDNIVGSLHRLYLHCTGRPLTAFRLR